MDHEVVVIGAGPGGLCAGVRLKQAGIEDFAILERGDGVGGSWRDNTYPGIGVDIPCFAYQFSFARKSDWTRLFPKGAEVLRYHEWVADRFGLRPHLRFGVDVVRESWDEERGLWELHGADGETICARFVISAVGAFLRPKADPGIPGVADFAGMVQRPAEWDHSYDHRGRRVAIVGTGASSVQITPALAGEVERLDVYQRTPVWCLPKPDVRLRPWMQRALGLPGVTAAVHGVTLAGVELGLRAIVSTPAPLAQRMMSAFDERSRAAYRALLRHEVEDPRVRAELEPRYGPLTKRPTISNAFLQAFNRPNTHLFTTPIERITARGVLSADGVEREVDMLVLATGYDLFSDPESYPPGMITGRGGFDLGAFYAEHGLQAYESVAVPGLPNRWTVVGPYSWTGTGWHMLVEVSTAHIVRTLAEGRRRGAGVIEVSAAAHERYHRAVLRASRNIRHYYRELNGHTRSYYVNSQGDIPFVRPSSVLQARRRATRFPLGDYVFERGGRFSRSGGAAARL